MFRLAFPYLCSRFTVVVSETAFTFESKIASARLSKRDDNNNSVGATWLKKRVLFQISLSYR